jgi:hypothetical protein
MMFARHAPADWPGRAAVADLVWWGADWFPRRAWVGGEEIEVADQGRWGA